MNSATLTFTDNVLKYIREKYNTFSLNGRAATAR